MGEYEYIVLAIDEILSHFVARTICLENYNDETSYSEDFKLIFKMFGNLKKDYDKRYCNNTVTNDIAKIKAEFRLRREEILKDFISKLSEIDRSIDFYAEAKEYFERIENEDVETLEMQLMVYPYLISLLRKQEESESR